MFKPKSAKQAGECTAAFPEKVGSPKGIRYWIHYLLPAVTALCVAAYIGVMAARVPVIEASINGTPVGYVRSDEVFSSAVRSLEGELSAAIGSDYKLDCEITYELRHDWKPVYLSEEDLIAYLRKLTADEFLTAYMLYVDDLPACAYENEEELLALVDSIETELLGSAGEDFSRIEISTRVRIEKQLCRKNDVKTLEEIHLLLNPATDHHADSAAVREETVEASVLTVDSLTYMAPDLANAAPATDEDFVLEYTLIKTEEMDEIVPYDTVRIDNPDAFVGKDSVITPGEYGYRTAVYEVVCNADGRELERTLLSETVHTPTVSEVILVGTKPIPPAVPTGTYIWPCDYSKGISSPYGARSYPANEFHLGIDLPGEKNSEIWASDGGTVIYAGQTPSYGKHVRIQHANGYITLYAHMNELLVKAGDQVYQGQTIGLMGTTGMSLGVHLHFEVRLGDVPRNPINYLPPRK